MKIIKPPPQFEPFEVTCNHCHAVLLPDLTDYQRYSSSDQRESWDYAICTCPCCKSTISLDSKKFPDHIYSALPQKQNGWYNDR